MWGSDEIRTSGSEDSPREGLIPWPAAGERRDRGHHGRPWPPPPSRPPRSRPLPWRWRSFPSVRLLLKASSPLLGSLPLPRYRLGGGPGWGSTLPLDLHPVPPNRVRRARRASTFTDRGISARNSNRRGCCAAAMLGVDRTRVRYDGGLHRSTRRVRTAEMCWRLVSMSSPPISSRSAMSPNR
jgi:hypothetical protein